LSLSWQVFSNGVLINLIRSTAVDPTVFQLSPYTLAAGSTYSFTATVFKTSTLQSTSNTVLVVVQPGRIKAVLSCSNEVTFSSDKRLTIDASGSYDEDKPGVFGLSAGLSFTWSCQTIKPKLSTSCSVYVVNSGVPNQPTLTFLSIAQNVPSTSLITVLVTSGTRVEQTNVSVYHIVFYTFLLFR
jgi:hypothetical protein